jgi:hypothetical protein
MHIMRKPLVRPLALVALPLALVATALSTPAAAHPSPRPHSHVLDSTDAVVTPPDSVTTRTLAPVQGCRTLLATGEGDCAVVHTANGDLVVTVEPGERIDDVLASRPWTVSVYRPSATVPDGWELALATRPELDEPGPLYAAVTARAVDVTGDGEDELLLGYRNEGTGGILDLDVVGTKGDGTPRVLAHDDLYKGSVVFRDGKLVTFTPVYQPADANCCPTWVARDVLRYDDGAFRVQRIDRVKTEQADVPASQLG